jgi:hypothetical protein
MANTTQDELYQSFLTVAGQQTLALGDATSLLADVVAQISEQQSGSPAPVAANGGGGTSGTAATTLLADAIAQVSEQQGGTLAAVAGQQTLAPRDASKLLADVIAQVSEQQGSNPAPVAASQTQTGTQTGSSGSGSTSGTVATTMLEAEAGLPLLIAGLVSAFSGGGTPTPAPLVKFAMPAAVDFQAAESQGQVTGLDYDQMGTPRSYAAAGTSGRASGTASGAGKGFGSGGADGFGSGGAPQITFNVQAMDARSFMDRSGDIALAVREAMLNLNSINDVVNDL